MKYRGYLLFIHRSNAISKHIPSLYHSMALLELSMSSTAALLSRSLTAEKKISTLIPFSTLSKSNLLFLVWFCSIITHDRLWTISDTRCSWRKVPLASLTLQVTSHSFSITPSPPSHTFQSSFFIGLVWCCWCYCCCCNSYCHLFLLSLSLFRQNKRRDERLRVLLPSFLGHSRPPILFLALYFHQRVGRTLHFLRSEVPCSRKEKKAIVTGNAWYREEHPQEEIDEWPHTLPRHLPFTILPCLFYFMVLVNKYVYVPWMFQLSSLL